MVARNTRLLAKPAAFETVREWYLDREGKAERYRRQIYSLTLSDGLTSAAAPGTAPRSHPQQRRARRSAAPARGALGVGLLTVLHWPGVGSKPAPGLDARPPFWFDTMSVFALPTRDGGRTFDLSSVYADAPILDPGGCRPASAVASQPPGAAATPPHASLACEFDAGFIEPSSELLTLGEDGHVLYYEGRPTQHSHRYWKPATIARARWPLHRLAGVRVDPACADAASVGTGQAVPAAPAASHSTHPTTTARCGQLETRAFELLDQHRVLSVNARALLSDHGLESSLAAALIDDASLEPIGGHERALAAQSADAVDVVLHWQPRDGAASTPRIDVALVGRRVRLRFELCGAAELFGFMLRPS